jgi:hypothetical protein
MELYSCIAAAGGIAGEIFLNARMPDLLAFGQSATGMKKLTVLEAVRY